MPTQAFKAAAIRTSAVRFHRHCTERANVRVGSKADVTLLECARSITATSCLHVGAKPFDRAGWVFQLKYDGFRVLAMRSGTGIRTPVTAGDRKNQMGV